MRWGRPRRDMLEEDMALSEQVTVLQDGTYLGPNLKAFEAKAGAVIEVLGGWYPAALVEAGMVERASEVDVFAEAKKPAGQVLADPADTVRLDQLEPAKPRKTRSRA